MCSRVCAFTRINTYTEYFQGHSHATLEANVRIVSVVLPCQFGVVFIASIAMLMVLYKNDLSVWWEGKGVVALPLAHSTILMCAYWLIGLKAACQVYFFFSKVSFTLTLYSKCSSKLTFEKSLPYAYFGGR